MISESVQAIGYIAQGLFSSRFIVQWIASEKAKKVLAPTLFWQLSLIASFMLIVYSILAKDITILFGQLIGYFIYIRNLNLQNNWKILPKLFRYFVLTIPVGAMLVLIFVNEYSLLTILKKHNNSLYLFWGLGGQIIFSSRFIYQWYYSEKMKKSVLPLGFWLISLSGSLVISTYSLYFGLYPIFLGHLFGILVYSRNIIIHTKEVKG